MSQRNRFWFVVFSVVVIAAVVILAGGVATLDLGYPGQPLPRILEEAEGIERDSPSLPTDFLATVMMVILVVSAALLPFAIILYIISPEARRKAFENLIIVLSILLPLYLLQRTGSEFTETTEELTVPAGAPQAAPSVPDIAAPPSPTHWLAVVATIGVALFLAALLVAAGWAIWRRKQRPSTSLDRLAEEAQHAVSAIEAGADLGNTVTRCYYEMMQILKEERGIRRQQAMTPREFEAALETVGIPTTQVRRLTRLFEQVRYGDKKLGQREERQAVVSLTSIARFCRSGS